MITQDRIVRCAESIVDSMNLKKGDSVLISGGIHARDLLEEIYIYCYKTGAVPMMTYSSDRLVSRVMDQIPAETLSQVPKHRLGATEGMDCRIAVEPYDDPRISTRFPRDKMEARVRSSVPIRKIVHGEDGGDGKKWCYAGWPTKKAADFYSIDYPLYEKFIIEGMTVPQDDLRSRCEAIATSLEGADEVLITDPNGTELQLQIGGRRINIDDGFVSDEDYEMNDRGNNLPAGEVFIAPHETEGSGRIFCPITIDRLTGKIIRDVELRVESGELQLEEAEASENLDALVNSFEQTRKVDEATQDTVRTLNVAELGIGCNPKITKAIGYVLTDEKIIGSAHVAFGSNFSYGGTSKSSMHWDFVTVPKVTMIARGKEIEDRVVIDGGRIAPL